MEMGDGAREGVRGGKQEARALRAGRRESEGGKGSMALYRGPVERIEKGKDPETPDMTPCMTPPDDKALLGQEDIWGVDSWCLVVVFWRASF